MKQTFACMLFMTKESHIEQLQNEQRKLWTFFLLCLNCFPPVFLYKWDIFICNQGNHSHSHDTSKQHNSKFRIFTDNTLHANSYKSNKTAYQRFGLPGVHILESRSVKNYCIKKVQNPFRKLHGHDINYDGENNGITVSRWKMIIIIPSLYQIKISQFKCSNIHAWEIVWISKYSSENL